MSTSFFTIIEKYFQCCTKRCTCCFNVKKEDRETTCNVSSGENSPFTFDDVSNPGTPGTPITWSSSSASWTCSGWEVMKFAINTRSWSTSVCQSLGTFFRWRNSLPVAASCQRRQRRSSAWQGTRRRREPWRSGRRTKVKPSFRRCVASDTSAGH